LTGGFIWVIPTTLAIAASAAMILEKKRGERESVRGRREKERGETKRSSPSQGVGVLLSELFEENESELEKGRGGRQICSKRRS
jgi:hypothetical protein